MIKSLFLTSYCLVVFGSLHNFLRVYAVWNTLWLFISRYNSFHFTGLRPVCLYYCFCTNYQNMIGHLILQEINNRFQGLLLRKAQNKIISKWKKIGGDKYIKKNDCHFPAWISKKKCRKTRIHTNCHCSKGNLFRPKTILVMINYWRIHSLNISSTITLCNSWRKQLQHWSQHIDLLWCWHEAATHWNGTKK